MGDEKFSYFESLDSPLCVEEDFGLKITLRKLAGDRHKACRVDERNLVYLLAESMLIVFFTLRSYLVSALKTFYI